MQKELWLKIQKIISLKRQSSLYYPVWIKDTLSCPLVYSFLCEEKGKKSFVVSFFLFSVRGYLRLRKAFCVTQSGHVVCPQACLQRRHFCTQGPTLLSDQLKEWKSSAVCSVIRLPSVHPQIAWRKASSNTAFHL